MKGAARYQTGSINRQNDEKIRLKVTNGPDKGAVFVVTGSRVTLGRGEECDIHLTDLKASRTHAELFEKSPGTWMIRDLGSANGLAKNGSATKLSDLKNGDALIIGDTQFEVALAGAAVSIGKSLIEQKKKVQALAQIGGVKDLFQAVGSPSQLHEGDNRKKILIVAVVVLLIWVLFDDSGGHKKTESTSQQAVKKEEKARDLSSYLPQTISAEAERTADVFFRAGFREFRERNFLRAKLNFETVLQIDPTHKLARIYLTNSEKEIEDEIKFLLERGKKTLNMGRLRESRGHFEAILRLLYRDQSHPAYIEASEQLKRINAELEGGAV